MRLGNMADAWQHQQRDAKVGALSFDERFSLLVDAEHQARDNRRLTRLLKDAQLRILKRASRTSRVVRAAASRRRCCGNSARAPGSLNTSTCSACGATGVGKSYLACALGQGACRKGMRVLYRRVPRLLDELALARADGSYARLLAKLAKVEILVLDDWGLAR